MSIKKLIKVLFVAAIATPVMQVSAFAGFRDGAFAAGIIGAAIGTAIMTQGRPQGPTYRRSYHRHAKSSKPDTNTTAATTSKDPFAGASAPADYAKPVSATAR
jgi:hypothetical protein